MYVCLSLTRVVWVVVIMLIMGVMSCSLHKLLCRLYRNGRLINFPGGKKVCALILCMCLTFISTRKCFKAVLDRNLQFLYSIYNNLILHPSYELHEALQCSVGHITLVVSPLACCSRTLPCTQTHRIHLTYFGSNCTCT